MQTRTWLTNSRNISMDKNEYNINNKLIRNIEVTNKVQKKRKMTQKIIQEIKLQEPVKKRCRPRKVMNKSPENDKKCEFMKTQDEYNSDPDYDFEKSLNQIRRRSILRKIKTNN